MGDPVHLFITATRMLTKTCTWEQIVVLAIHNLGGEAHLKMIYSEARKLREELHLGVAETYRATIRRECQKSKLIVQDVYRSGVWRLASNVR